MSMHYELIDIDTLDLIGSFESWPEMLAVLDFNLKHNGAAVIRDLELFIGNTDGPVGSVHGDMLLEIAQRHAAQQVTVICHDSTPGIEFAARMVATSISGIGGLFRQESAQSIEINVADDLLATPRMMLALI